MKRPAAQVQRERFPNLKDDIGEDPARFLDRDLLGTDYGDGNVAALTKARISGIDEGVGWERCRDVDVVPPSLTTDGGRSLLKRLCDEANLEIDGEYLKPHGGRRGLGDQLYEEDTELTQEVLRHKSVETTHESYRDRNAEENREDVEEILSLGDSNRI